ncbi:MAG: type II toxin-antitoxin system VapC family toxin [Candidatus Riflebacteria bacterium]|nr:type II toxin-antitoxin system VapC family toxin [Candidatus Riflebacteria bacterium]
MKESMSKIFVLDTSAIFSFTENEEGCEVVEKILKTGKIGECQIFLSFISLTEIYYITWQEKCENVAKELIILVKSLPLQIVNSNERIALSAGRIKANYRLSVADSIIAATAIEKKAILVHKDPELKAISNYVNTLELPFKEKTIPNSLPRWRKKSNPY